MDELGHFQLPGIVYGYLRHGADRHGNSAFSSKATLQYFKMFTLLAQNVFYVITYSWKYLLDIRAAVTHQCSGQKHDFPKLDPLVMPSKAIYLIPYASPRRRQQRRGIWSRLLVRLRRRSHHLPLLRIQCIRKVFRHLLFFHILLH